MQIRYQLAIMPIIFVIGVIVMSLVYSHQTTTAQRSMDNIQNVSFPRVERLSKVQEALSSAHRRLKEMAIMAMLGELGTEIRAHGDQGIDAIDTSLGLLREPFGKEKAGGSDQSVFEQEVSQYRAGYEEIIRICAVDADAYTASQSFANMDTLYASIAGYAANAIVAERKRLDSEYMQHTANGKRNAVIFHVASAAVVLASALVLFVIARRITHRIDQLVGMFKDIAQGEGDLTKRLDANARDEFGNLSRWFNTFMDRLQETILNVVQSTLEVSTGAQRLQSITEETGHTMSRQHDETGQVATAVTELAATAGEVSRNINETADAAHKANGQVRKGHELATTAIDMIDNLVSDVARTASAIDNLHSDSEKIDTILETINGISEQTSLLALNAAIEAARAGESGRGFAVVADEVRALASRTRSSTDEIRTLIDGLKSNTNTAVGEIDNSRSSVENSVQQVQEVSSALVSIGEAMQTIQQMAEQIATAAEEQTNVVEEIDRNVTNISGLSDQTSQGATDAAATSSKLAETASDLKELTTQFRA